MSTFTAQRAKVTLHPHTLHQRSIVIEHTRRLGAECTWPQMPLPPGVLLSSSRSLPWQRPTHALSPPGVSPASLQRLLPVGRPSSVPPASAIVGSGCSPPGVCPASPDVVAAFLQRRQGLACRGWAGRTAGGGRARDGRREEGLEVGESTGGEATSGRRCVWWWWWGGGGWRGGGGGISLDQQHHMPVNYQRRFQV